MPGVVRHGRVWFLWREIFYLARSGPVRFGRVRRGRVRYGMARFGLVRLGGVG